MTRSPDDHSNSSRPARDPSSTLLVSPRTSTERFDLCRELVTPVPIDRLNLLVISYTGTATERVASWYECRDELPAEFGMIYVGRDASVDRSVVNFDANSVEVTRIEHLRDFAGLGLAVRLYLDRWSANGNPIAVCFDSLTPLVRNVGYEDARELIDVVTGQFESAGAAAHFHVDSAAHPLETLESLESHFDEVVEASGDDRRARRRTADESRDGSAEPRRSDATDGGWHPDAYTFSYAVDDEPLSLAVVRAVSAAENADPLHARPLNEILDPQALDEIYDDRPDGSAREGGMLKFVYCGWEVLAVGTERILVRERG